MAAACAPRRAMRAPSAWWREKQSYYVTITVMDWGTACLPYRGDLFYRKGGRCL